MGLRDRLRGKTVYVDANILIYLIEGSDTYGEQMEDIAAGIYAGDFVCLTSELSLCEVLVVPMRTGNLALEHQYRAFIEHSGAIEMVATWRETCVLASRCRADFGLKTPDAILSGADVFLTNDRPVRVPPSLELVHF